MCKFAITRKNNAFVAKIVNIRLTKMCMAIFALAERLPTSATLPGHLENMYLGQRKIGKPQLTHGCLIGTIPD